MDEIIQVGGNNWRKIFNIYSKLCFNLLSMNDHNLSRDTASWQEYRDKCLLRESSIFSLQYLYESLLSPVDNDSLYILTGKKCVQEYNLTDKLVWINKDFAQVEGMNIVVCPYFDYRQLSNEKLETLTQLVSERIDLTD